LEKVDESFLLTDIFTYSPDIYNIPRQFYIAICLKMKLLMISTIRSVVGKSGRDGR
jgi:hypothetical protein